MNGLARGGWRVTRNARMTLAARARYHILSRTTISAALAHSGAFLQTTLRCAPAGIAYHCWLSAAAAPSLNRTLKRWRVPEEQRRAESATDTCALFLPRRLPARICGCVRIKHVHFHLYTGVGGVAPLGSYLGSSNGDRLRKARAGGVTGTRGSAERRIGDQAAGADGNAAACRRVTGVARNALPSPSPSTQRGAGILFGNIRRSVGRCSCCCTPVAWRRRAAFSRRCARAAHSQNMRSS